MRVSKHIGRCMAAAVAAMLLCLTALGLDAEIIGSSTHAMSPRRTSRSLGACLEETALGDYVADAFRIGTGADVDLVPGGMLVQSLPGGDLTAEDAAAVFAADEKVCVVDMPESRLFAVLEEALSPLTLADDETLDPDSGSDGFLQISGIAVTFDVSQRAGQRIRSITAADGTALSVSGVRSFTVAVPECMLDGSLGFSMLTECEAVSVSAAAELLCSHIKEQGQVTIPETDRYTQLGAAGQTLYEQFKVSSWLPYLVVAIAVVRLSFQKHRAREADGSPSKRYWK